MHMKRYDPMTGIVISQLDIYKPDDSHAHDDTVDVVVDFINNEIPDNMISIGVHKGAV
jgi:hypothetical protein